MADGILNQLLSAFGGPWIDRAKDQTAQDIAAYQRGGLSALMANTQGTQDLAGGFGGNIRSVGQGIRAYHGSPYDFEKFDLSKIGTGEGAQSYGHGLYFAENPAVAEAYKKALTGINPNSLGSGKGQFGVSGVPMPSGISGHAALDTGQQMDLLLGTMKINPDSTMIPYLKQQIENRIGSHYSMEAGGSAGDDMRAMAKYYNDYVKNAQPKDVSSIAPGKMYEVNINARPEQFLDWEKSLSQQPQAAIDPLREAIAKEAYGRALASTSKPRADQLWGMVKDPMSAPGGFAQELLRKPEITQSLNEAGIPGIRYLDQGSRGQAQGTSNYVVFNPSIVDILRKYGLAGTLPALMAQDYGQQPTAP